MNSQEEEEIKNIIRSLLISNPNRSTQQQLWREFQEMVGGPVPLRKLGFRTFDEYLRSIPNVVQVFGYGALGEVGAVTSKSQHISEMVQKQKKHPPKHKKFFARPVSTVRYNPRQSCQRSSVQLPSTNQRFSNVKSPHEPRKRQSVPQDEEIYKPNLNFNHKFQQENPVPILKKAETDLSLVPSNDPQTNLDLLKPICGDYKECETDSTEFPAASSIEFDHTSQVPVKVQNNLLALIQKFPQGIECTRLPTEYRAMYKKNIHYEDYGYRSLIEMCTDLPKIFNYIRHSSHDYMLYDVKQAIPTQDLQKKSTKQVNSETVVKKHVLEDLPNVNWSSSSALLPSDVFTIDDQLCRFFPADVKENDILDITVAEIYDLSKFWFYMTFGDLDPLMDSLQTFFLKNKDSYVVPELLLEEGLYCVALYANLYHRCVIVNMLPKSPHCVRVFFVDYGTVENVSSKEIWFLPKQFGDVPAQAIRGRLTTIYPTYENQPWTVPAIGRFEQLITNRVIVGKVTRVDERDHLLELYLADITNKDKIFYLNDVFVDEGLALYVGDERKISFVDHDCMPNVRNLHLYPEFYEIENGMAPTTEEMKYIVTNKIPMHHYLPQYFDIYYEEDINAIVQDYERYGCKRNKQNSSIPIVELEFDFSFFPESFVDEIKELYFQDHPQVEVPVKSEKHNSRTVPKTELSGEKKTNESVKEYFCNRKRISEIRQGTTTTKAEKRDGKNVCDNSLISGSFSDNSTVPLSDVFQQLSVADSSAMSVLPSRASNNPFFADTSVRNTNPFRSTNPFLNDIELDETVDTSQLLDLFSKPSDETMSHKIVNNLKDSTCGCKKDKQVNVEKCAGVACNNNVARPTDTSEVKSTENTTQRIRTPPGFNSSNISSTLPALQSVPNNNFFVGPRNNPYYERFPFQNAPLLQNPLAMPYGVPMQGNYFGNLPQMFPNMYNLNAVNWPQMFPQQNFRPPPRYPQ